MGESRFSRWYLADLHVHTTADANHKYATAYESKEPNIEFANELIGKFAAAGVSVIALTDHNRVDWWPVLKEAGRRKGVTVFPGVEISVNRCHLIGVWDANANGFDLAKQFASTLHRPGQSPYVNGGPRAVASGNVEENAKKMVDHGGLVIAPHSTNRTLGMFGPGVCSNASDIAQSELVAAFDVFGNPSADVLQNPRSQFIDVPPRWILTGDTRAFDELGKRAVWLKLGAKPTLEGLRQAFIAPSTRIRFPDSLRTDWGRVKTVQFAVDPAPTWPRLETIRIQGGFHDGLDLALAPGLNAIIGGKGTGKSALIEILRHSLGLRPPTDSMLLGNRARNMPVNSDAEITFVGADREEYTVRRSGGSTPPRLESRGVASDIEVDRRVRVNIFGQRELTDLATSGALRDFLARRLGDQWGDVVELQRLTTRDLEQNAARMTEQERDLVDLEEQAAEQKDLNERLERARAAGAQKVIAKLEALGRAHQQVRRAISWPSKATDALDTLRALLPVPLLPSEPKDVKNLGEAYVALAVSIASALKTADPLVEAAATAAAAAQIGWTAHHASQKAAFERELAEAGVANPQDLATWQGRLSELDDSLQSLPDLKAAYAENERARKGLLVKLRGHWRVKSRLLDKASRDLVSVLPPKVRLTTLALADRSEFRMALDGSVQSQGVRSDQLDRLASQDPEVVLKAMAAGVDEVIALGVTANTAAKLANIRRSTLRALEMAEVKDTVRVEMDLSNDAKGDWREVANVSPGQRATALLALVLAGGSDPLIIDQPEDDLDNRYIYEEVAQVLARVCETRQVIVATHNANIPILGDAELIVALDATADRGRAIAAGGLEDPAVANAARMILEGGEEAFLARSRRYLAARA